MKCVKARRTEFRLDEIAENSYLAVAINGEHGVEGAYAALKINGEYVGAPSRAVSFPANPWENVTSKTGSNYTYFFPLTRDMINKPIEVFVLGYDADYPELESQVWITSYPIPYSEKIMTIYR